MSTTMNNSQSSEALRVRIFASAIIIALVAAVIGGGVLMLLVNGIPLSMIAAQLQSAGGVVVALAVVGVGIYKAPQWRVRVNRYFDLQSQIAVLLTERNEALTRATTAEAARDAAAEAHAVELSDVSTAHAIQIADLTTTHTATIKRMLRERREGTRQQFAAWHKGHAIVIKEREAARALATALQEGKEQKLLQRAGDLTTVIVAAINGDLSRDAVRSVVPLSNANYKAWSADLVEKVTVALDALIVEKHERSEDTASPTLSHTVPRLAFSAVETPVEAPTIEVGDEGQRTDVETAADGSADGTPENADEPTDAPVQTEGVVT